MKVHPVYSELPGVHVNYSFSKFLGIGLFNDAASLGVGPYCWQEACVPRSHNTLLREGAQC